MWNVYILKSLKDHKLYIGCTNNLDRRLKEHNTGQIKSIANRTPFELLYKEEYADQTEAYKREKVLKQYKGGNGLRKLLGKNGE